MINMSFLVPNNNSFGVIFQNSFHFFSVVENTGIDTKAGVNVFDISINNELEFGDMV